MRFGIGREYLRSALYLMLIFASFLPFFAVIPEIFAIFDFWYGATSLLPQVPVPAFLNFQAMKNENSYTGPDMTVMSVAAEAGFADSPGNSLDSAITEGFTGGDEDTPW